MFRLLAHLSCALIIALTAHSVFALGLNDVSVLLPLPADAAEHDALLHPITEEHVFFPYSIFQRVPPLLPNIPRQQMYDDSLRLIAIRIDPCFEEGLTPAGCRHQIRLVWQPVLNLLNQWMGEDAAAHSFYDFSDQEWAQVLNEWRQLPAENQDEQPLQVSPTIKAQRFSGPYWQALRGLLLRHCDQAHLSRVTFSTLNSLRSLWIFAGFNVSNGVGTALPIPKTSGVAQSFQTDINDLREFFGGVRPAPAGEPDWVSLLQHSVGAHMTMSDDRMIKTLQHVYSFENPRLNNAGTLDCVSCHVAQSARLWADSHYPQWSTTNVFASVNFTSRWNLKNTSTDPYNANHLRAFGYFLNETLISQRMINETAIVADRLGGDSSFRTESR